jgi:hypothetical protein
LKHARGHRFDSLVIERQPLDERSAASALARARELRIESANRRRKSFFSAVVASAIRGAAARARFSAAIVSGSTVIRGPSPMKDIYRTSPNKLRIFRPHYF